MTTILLKESLPVSVPHEIVVNDVLGKELSRIKINPELKFYTVNTKAWPSGMYIYRILTPNYELDLHGKFEVQH